MHVAQAQAEDKVARQEAKEARQKEVQEARIAEMLDYVRANPGKSAASIKGYLGINDHVWKPLRDLLLDSGRIVVEKVQCGRRACDGFFPAQDASK